MNKYKKIEEKKNLYEFAHFFFLIQATNNRTIFYFLKDY